MDGLIRKLNSSIVLLIACGLCVAFASCAGGKRKGAGIRETADGAPTITSVEESCLGTDIDSLPAFGNWLSRDTVLEGDEGVSWKGRAWYSGRQLVVLAETNWEDAKRIHRVTVYGPQIKEGALFVGQRMKDIRGLVSGTIPSGPDGYLFLTYKKDSAVSIQLDISRVTAGSRLFTGVSEIADVPDSLLVENLVIMETVHTDSLEILSGQWKNDSLGCTHVRSIAAFGKLLKGYSLAQKNEAEIVQVLGPPNAEERYPGKSIAIYYFESVCAANKIIKGSDKSSIMLTFDQQKRYQRYDTSIE